MTLFAIENWEVLRFISSKNNGKSKSNSSLMRNNDLIHQVWFLLSALKLHFRMRGGGGGAGSPDEVFWNHGRLRHWKLTDKKHYLQCKTKEM